MKEILGHEPWEQVNTTALWECVCKQIGRMRGTDGYAKEIRERLPQEYPDYVCVEDEQPKKISHH